MKTQVSFVTDAALKKAALQKAKKQGITLKAFLNFCLKSFLDNKIELGIVTKDEPLVLEQIDFDDLPPDAQKEYLRVKDMSTKEFIKA